MTGYHRESMPKETAGYSNYLREERLLLHRGRWYAQQMAKYCQPGRILDVGAAGGFSVQAFREAGWTAAGVEPNVAMATYARQRLALPVEAAAFEIWTNDQTFDLVTMLQVLPHFVDPAQALAKARLLLKPGGYLLIETWDRASWTARLLGKNWHEYSPPSVLHWFSRGGLIQLARSERFEPIAHGRPPKWILAEHAKSLLSPKSNRSAMASLLAAIAWLLPDRLAFPYPLDDLFWILLRRP